MKRFSFVILACFFCAQWSFCQGVPQGTWETVFTDDFSTGDKGLVERWRTQTLRSFSGGVDAFTPGPGMPVKVVNGSLFADNVNGVAENTYCDMAFRGDIRIEWDVTALREPRDYNCFIGGKTRMEGVMFHVAAFGDRKSVTVQNPVTGMLDKSVMPGPFQTGQSVHMMMELMDGTVNLHINGALIVSIAVPRLGATDASGVFFGFENNQHNSQSIDNVRVQVFKPVSGSMAVGVSSFTDDDFNVEDGVLFDFSNPPSSFQKDKWNIRLSASSDSGENRNNSDWRIIDVDTGSLGFSPAFDRCLGLKISMNSSMEEDWATFSPIPAMSVSNIPEGQGIIRNIGVLKSITITARGGSPGHYYEIRFKDRYGQLWHAYFPILNFDGWRVLKWDNPAYFEEKKEFARRHSSDRQIVFDTLVVHKSHWYKEGIFVGYIKDIRIQYGEK